MELFIESPCIVLEKLKIQIKDFYLIKDSFPKRIRQKKKKKKTCIIFFYTDS